MPQKSFLAPAGPVRPLPPDPFNWSVEQVCAFVSLQDAASNRIIRALRVEEIDGPAFLLLTMAACTGPPLDLQPREVTRLCEIVELAKFKYAKMHLQPFL